MRLCTVVFPESARLTPALASPARLKRFQLWQFGEHFTVERLPDGEVCIGDRYRIGSAVFEVTQR
jgi:MOSC domain-containing protein YiiM